MVLVPPLRAPVQFWHDRYAAAECGHSPRVSFGETSVRFRPAVLPADAIRPELDRGVCLRSFVLSPAGGSGSRKR